MGLKPSAVPATNPDYLPKHLTHQIQTCQDGQQSILYSNFEMSEIVFFFKAYYFPHLQYLYYFLCLLGSLLTARFIFFHFYAEIIIYRVAISFFKKLVFYCGLPQI